LPPPHLFSSVANANFLQSNSVSFHVPWRISNPQDTGRCPGAAAPPKPLNSAGSWEEEARGGYVTALRRLLQTGIMTVVGEQSQLSHCPAIFLVGTSFFHSSPDGIDTYVSTVHCRSPRSAAVYTHFVHRFCIYITHHRWIRTICCLRLDLHHTVYGRINQHRCTFGPTGRRRKCGLRSTAWLRPRSMSCPPACAICSDSGWHNTPAGDIATASGVPQTNSEEIAHYAVGKNGENRMHACGNVEARSSPRHRRMATPRTPQEKEAGCLFTSPSCLNSVGCYLIPQWIRCYCSRRNLRHRTHEAWGFLAAIYYRHYHPPEYTIASNPVPHIVWREQRAGKRGKRFDGTSDVLSETP
jgi:hypothetical protein